MVNCTFRKPAHAATPCHLASARQHPGNQKENQAGHSPERAVEGPLECGIAHPPPCTQAAVSPETGPDPLLPGVSCRPRASVSRTDWIFRRSFVARFDRSLQNPCRDTPCRKNGPRVRVYQKWIPTSRITNESRKILRENRPHNSRTFLRERSVTVNLLATDRRWLPPPPHLLPLLREQTRGQNRMPGGPRNATSSRNAV